MINKMFLMESTVTTFWHVWKHNIILHNWNYQLGVYSPGTTLTHWGRVTHICVGNLATIGSDNGLSPGRRQAITRTNAGILLIGPPGTNSSEMLIEIHAFSFKRIHLKMSSAKWRPFCLGLNVLKSYCSEIQHRFIPAVHIQHTILS